MLRQRVITAIWFTPLILAAAWFGNPWFPLILSFAAILGVKEFYRIASKAQGQSFIYLGMGLTLLFLLSPLCPYPATFPFLLTFALLSTLIWSLCRENFPAWLWTSGGAFYIGWLLGYLLALRGLDSGREWVILALLTTFAYDTFAYFSGRAWGKHHFFSSVSPGKTLEGGLGGLLAAISACLILSCLFRLPLSYGWSIYLGFSISVLAQLGDLVESLFKRYAGAKDSGKLLPGHGGILDRLDSVVFTAPLVYYFVLWVA